VASCTVGVGGLLRHGGIDRPGHPSSTLEERPRLDYKNGCLKVSAKPARGGDFCTMLGVDITEDLAANLNVANLDIGMNDSLLPHDQAILADDRTMKGSVNPQRIRKLQLTRNLSAVVEKPGHTLFRLSPTRHAHLLVKIGLSSGHRRAGASPRLRRNAVRFGLFLGFPGS
jgi:hypothetical protein